MLQVVNQVTDLPDFKQRVLCEYIELKDKHDKLKGFLASERIHEMNPAYQQLLHEQFRVMGMYMSILELRMDFLSK